MNLDVGRPFISRSRDVGVAHVAAASLHAGGDRQQRPQLCRHRRALGVGDDRVDERAVITKMTRRDGRVTVMAEAAVVQRRDRGGDQFSLAAAQRTRGMEEDVGECAHRLRDVGTDHEQRADPGDALGDSDMGHNQTVPMRP